MGIVKLIIDMLSLNADCRVIKNEGRLKMRPFKWVMPDEYWHWQEEWQYFKQHHERLPLQNNAIACLVSFLVAGWIITWPESFVEGVIRLLCFLFFLCMLYINLHTKYFLILVFQLIHWLLKKYLS
mgnify:CR=1 FL=1